MELNALIHTEEYAFLHQEERLGSRILLLGLSGSRGYGTGREDSDVDLRGVTLNLPSDLIGLTEFEQYEERKTDTVIYAFNKFVKLLLACNPNAIEILGLDEDQYAIRTELGQKLLDNRGLFLSKRAAASFGHYAEAQLRKLQNATARDSVPQSLKEKHILTSVNHAMENFERNYGNAGREQVHLYIDDAETEGMDKEIFLDGTFRHVPFRSFYDRFNTLHSVVREYDRLGRRNRKKDDDHLNKHAMHLVRMFMMGIDILEKREIRTHRPEGDLVLLNKIRNGAYMEDSVMTPEFYKIVSEYEQRFAEAEKKSSLPDRPDEASIGKLMEEINRHVILEDFA